MASANMACTARHTSPPGRGTVETPGTDSEWWDLGVILGNENERCGSQNGNGSAILEALRSFGASCPAMAVPDLR